MQHSTQIENQRESYRFAVGASGRTAELRVGDDWIPVELLDKSAGGFGVQIDRPLGVSVGDLLQLRLDDDCFEARVMHVGEQTPSGDRVQPTFRLGLKRVGEILLDEEEKRPWFERFIVKSNLHKSFGSPNTLFYALLVFAVLAGAAPVIFIYLMDSQGLDGSMTGLDSDVKPFKAAGPWSSSSEPPDTQPTRKKPLNSSENIPARNTLERFFFGTEKKPPLEKPRLNGRRDTSLSLLLDHAKLQSNIGKWSDEVLSVVSNLLDKLNLTDPQEKEIDTILKNADEKITQLNVPDPDNTPQKVARERTSILETAYDNLVQVFTAAQRIQWDELVNGWTKSLQTPAGQSENSDQ